MSRNLAEIAKEIEKQKKEIGEHRDALQELIQEMVNLAETCDQAADALERAIDFLSEQT